MLSLSKKRWDIYFTPLCHHDYGYTKTIEPLLADYIQFYRDVIKYIELTDAYPEEAKFRYTCEEVWSVHHFLARCTEIEKEKFIAYARQGRIEVSAFWGNIAETHCSNEEIIRMMYPAFELKRKYGIPVYGASLVDMTGQGWGIPKIMSGAGLEYLFNGMPAYFNWDVHNSGQVHEFWDEKQVLRYGRPDAYWWEAQDGGRVLTYYQGSYGWFEGAMGASTETPETLEDVERILPKNLAEAEEQGIPFNVLRYVDHGSDNRPPKMTISDIARRWNQKYDNPKLIVSTNMQFFRRLHEDCGISAEKPGDLRVWRGEIPHTDYTYAVMSFARETGLNFRNHIAAAEADFLSTAAQFCLNKPANREGITGVYNDMLTFDEHCYGMNYPIGVKEDFDWSSKAHHVYRAAAMAQEIRDEAAVALVSRIASTLKDPGGNAVVTVFNSLSFSRSDAVRISSLPLNPEECTLVDLETGAEVPFTVYEVNRHNLTDEHSAEFEICYRMGERFRSRNLVFLAKDVPPMGWKSYRLVPGAAKTSDTAGADSGSKLENSFYRIDFDAKSGRIESVFDKEQNRELIDRNSPHPFAAVICRDCHTQELILPQYSGLEIVHQSPVMQKAIVRFSIKGIPEGAMGITLYKDIKRIEFELKLLLNGLPAHEWLMALPLDIEQPEFEYEGSQCRPTPWRDQFPGSNTNHYTVQSWASSGNKTIKAVLSSIESHIVYFGSLWPNYVSQAHHAIHAVDFGRPFADKSEIKKGGFYFPLAWNNGRVNFHMSQNGEVRYTFALTTGKGGFEPTRFGWGYQNRLGAAAVKIPAPSPALQDAPLAGSFSIAQVGADNVQILTLKTAEDGDGLIMRLMETEGRAVGAQVKLNGAVIKEVIETNLVEEIGPLIPHESGSFTVSVNPFETKTLRIKYITKS